MRNSHPGEDSAIRGSRLAEANEYLALRKNASVRMAAATFLCIVSVIPLLILGTLAESPAYGILENTASAAGLIVLFLFIAAAVAAFLSCSFKNAPYAFLDKEPFDTEYGVTGMVSERQRQYKSTYARCNMVGTMLCILSPVPIFIGMAGGERSCDDPRGVRNAVPCRGRRGGFRCDGRPLGGHAENFAVRRLRSGGEKAQPKGEGTFRCLLDARCGCVFLGWNFTTRRTWKNTWIVWPVAGVLYAAVLHLYRLFTKSRED